MNPRNDDEFDFPGDRQCKTLKEIRTKLRGLGGISENERKEALESVNKLLKILKCDK